MSDNIELRAMAFLSAFPATQFEFPASDQPWPHRSDLALALEYIEELCKALHDAKAGASESIGDSIKHARESRDLSLAETAKMAGMTKAHLWEIESGRATNPSLEIMRGLSRALELRPAIWFSVPLIAEAVEQKP
jgi:DNA-binding XRE family transcriptional regulator